MIMQGLGRIEEESLTRWNVVFSIVSVDRNYFDSRNPCKERSLDESWKKKNWRKKKKLLEILNALFQWTDGKYIIYIVLDQLLLVSKNK